MAGNWIADPTGEGTGTQLDISDGTVYKLRSQDFPAPEPKPTYATPADADGERVSASRYQNRTVTLEVLVLGANADAIQTAATALASKCAKLTRDAVVNGTGVGGTLQYTTPAADTIVFDVCSARYSAAVGDRDLFARSKGLPVTLTFECLPFARGASVTLSDHAETTLPYLAFTESTIAGDVPALGRLVIDNDQTSADQQWLAWGLRSKTYSSASTADVFYQAEGRTPQGAGAATSTACAGYSGSGEIYANALSTNLESILSTQAVSGGAHLTHVGRYRVFARVNQEPSNAGVVSVALEWAVGDFRAPNRNTVVALPTGNRNSWEIVDLGVVDIPAVASGAQRWEGRLLASSTGGSASEELYVDWLLILPAEASGVASSTSALSAPSVYVNRDEFYHAAGTLNGKTAPTGGTWAWIGSGTDFGTTGAGYVTRSATGAQQWGVLGSTSYAAIAAEVDVKTSTAVSGDQTVGLLFRYVDSTHYGIVEYTLDEAQIRVSMLNGGSGTNSGWVTIPAIAADVYQRIRVFVDAAGNVRVWCGVASAALGSPVIEWRDPLFATGAALDDGKVGFHDYAAAASTRTFTNFHAWQPPADAACFSKVSTTPGQVAVRDDGCIRLDSGLAFWNPVSRYEGDRLLVPVSGAEARPVQVVAKMSRGVPGEGVDSGIDDVSAVLTVIPRYLQVPG